MFSHNVCRYNRNYANVTFEKITIIYDNGSKWNIGHSNFTVAVFYCT